MALSLLALTGCSMGTHPGSGPQRAGGAGADRSLSIFTTPGKSEVDKVTWNVSEGEPQTIDPYLSADTTPNTINSNMCETLLTQTPQFKIKPNLAQSVDNPDPLHWVYHLRKGVKFWDGSPMTAQDVAWSLNHNRTDGSTFYHYLYANVKGIAVTGTDEVTVTLKRPDYLFNDELASYAGVIVQKKFYEEHGSKTGSPGVGVMCTGPYEFKSWQQGQSITAVRNPHYWNTAVHPKVKELDFTFITDETALVSALQSGQVDGAYDVPTAGIPQLSASPVGKLTVGPSPYNLTYVYANPKGPMANLGMRKALQLAVDWQGLGDKTFNGIGVPTKLTMPPSVFGFASKPLETLANSVPNPKSAQYAKAKAILAKVPANIRKKQVTMVVTDQSTTQRFGLAVKDAATRIGMKFKLLVVPTTGYSNYLYDPKTRGNADMLYTEFWPNIPNPLDWIGITAVSGGSFNQYNYGTEDARYTQAVATKDPAKRARLTAQIEQNLHNQLLPMAPGVQIYCTVWMNNRITGAPAAYDYVYYPWAVHLGGTS